MDGLWPGFDGTGYLDMGGNVGDAVSFTLTAPSAGTYTLAVTYANGGDADRPMTVDADRVYALDLAANVSAANGGGLTLFLNGEEVRSTDFPGAGDAGEATVFVELVAGTDYQLHAVSDAPGAGDLDYLDVRTAPGNPNTDVAVESLDAAFLDERLHFSWIDNPASSADTDRDFKEGATVHVSNEGSEVLEVREAVIEGPFGLADPGQFDGLTLAAGQSVDVEVLFDRDAYQAPTADAASGIFEGVLMLTTNDADSPVVSVDLVGFWQRRDEGGWEPNVNEVWDAFGFGNVIEGLATTGGSQNSTLSTNDVYAKTDATEVLSPYWRIADGHTEAKSTQITAFHGAGGATIGIHGPGDKGGANDIQFWNHGGDQNQTLLPLLGNGTFATRTFDNGDIPDAWEGATCSASRSAACRSTRR